MIGRVVSITGYGINSMGTADIESGYNQICFSFNTAALTEPTILFRCTNSTVNADYVYIEEGDDLPKDTKFILICSVSIYRSPGKFSIDQRVIHKVGLYNSYPDKCHIGTS